MSKQQSMSTAGLRTVPVGLSLAGAGGVPDEAGSCTTCGDVLA